MSKVLDQDQTPLGDTVKVSDMISADTKIEKDGSVSGTLKYVASFKDFSNNPAEQSGHYFPFTLTGVTGSQMTLKKNGTAREDKTNIPFDKDFIFRVENKSDTFEVIVDEKPIVKLNFTKATLDETAKTIGIKVPEDAYQVKVGSGTRPASELQEGVTLEGDALKGTLKYVSGYTDFDASDPDGNYLVLVVDEAIGQPADTVKFLLKGSQVNQKEAKGVDPADGTIVVKIRNTDTTIEFTSAGKTTRTLTCAGLTLTAKS